MGPPQPQPQPARPALAQRLSARLSARLQADWWRPRPSVLCQALRPLSWLYAAAAALHRAAYRRGWRQVLQAPVPVVVVGNRDLEDGQPVEVSAEPDAEATDEPAPAEAPSAD